MKLEKHHIDQIKKSFGEMQSKHDLLQLLNQVKPLIYGKNAVPFELKQLTWYANHKLGGKRYLEFKIRKKSGSERIIHAPVKGLKALQKTLALILQCIYIPTEAATGFVRDKSVVDNAILHVGSKYVYNIDLKDFFSSIDQARVWKCFQLKPFNLISKRDPIELNESEISKGLTSPMFNFNKGHHSIYKYHFYNENYSLGFYCKTLKNGGQLTYSVKSTTNYRHSVDFYVFKNRVEQKINDLNTDNFGELIVYKSQSDIDYIRKEAIKLKSQHDVNLEVDEIVQILIQNSITQHQNSLPKRKKEVGVADIIASICCTEIEVERKNKLGEWQKLKRNVLPQGAPTSPVITNIVCQRLDYLLSGVAKRFGLKYSRYADDITFSSMHNVYQAESEFLQELHRIITEQNFHIKESKTRLQKDGFRKEVTGLLINDKVNVHQRYIKQLRMWLYYWERYGYDRASEIFVKQYIADKGHVKKSKPYMENVISGKLDYLKMVKGKENELYQKLRSRFEKITGKEASVSNNQIEIEDAEKGNTSLMKFFLGFSEQPTVLPEEIIIDHPTKLKIEEKPIPILHKPKDLVALLKNFSVNDSALKYTTHSWDAGRDANMFKNLSEFLSIAKSQYSEFSYALKGLSENLNGKIYNFLFNKEIGKSGWGDINPKKRIYFGWSSPELLEACKNDISLNPDDFILPERFQIQRAGKTLQKFKHIIDVFKNEIEVRDENSALLNLILQKHDNYLISFSAPKISNLENKTFYTDIQWLSKALDLIFEGIQKYPQHPLVEYAVTENSNDHLVLTILHRNSFKKGLSIYDDKLILKRGDFSTIKDKLRNLCDWYIESEFAEGPYRINYLVSENEKSAYEKIMSAEGFKHILTFYK